MLKNLKLLLSLRAWLKSGTLQAGGLVALVGQIQMWFATDDGMRILAMIAQAVGLTAETFSGGLLSLIGLIMMILRAKTEKSLTAKVEAPIGAETHARLVLAVGFLLGFSALSPQFARADVASGTPLYSWTNPTTWTDGSALTASQITGYQLVCNGSAQRIGAGSLTSFQTPTTARYAAGPYSCTLAVFAKQTATAPEQLSVATAPVSFTVPQPRANAVTGFSVE